MQLKTWTIYEANNLVSINGEPLIDQELYTLVIRPDIHTPNQVIVLGIKKEFGSTAIVDLMNKDLAQETLVEIFQQNLGTIKSADFKISKFSNASIREENIVKLISIYNIFVKKNSLEFDTDHFASIDQMSNQEDVFAEIDFQNMNIGQILATLSAGMKDWISKSTQLEQMNPSIVEPTPMRVELDKEFLFRKDNLFGLQKNLILFFDQAVRKMNQVLNDQFQTNQELKKRLEEKGK